MKVRKKAKLVQGVGINDAVYPVNVTAIIAGRQKLLWRCPLYEAWKNMLARCYSDKYQAANPTYAGCTVSPEWHSFSAFREWMAAQPWEGNQIDKDLLYPGNKVYSPETCVFVSRQLNTFVTDGGAAHGEFAIGAGWNKSKGKFKARCRNPFTRDGEHIGYFSDPYEAHEAWRKRKHELACRYADQQADPRIAAALRTRYARPEEV